MRLALALTLAVLALATVPARADEPAAAAKPAPAPVTYGVAAIRAYLYFHETGTWGDKDITDGKVALWNTIIGEGDAGAPSNMTIVYVDVVGPGFFGAHATLDVVVKAGKATVVKKKYAVDGYFSEKGQKLTFPLLVPETGCEELSVTATLTVAKKKYKSTTTIPFNCGE